MALAPWKNALQVGGLLRDRRFWTRELHAVEGSLEALQARMDVELPRVARVYVTFAREEYQRKVLKKLSTGMLQSMFEHSTLPAHYRFRGVNVLTVQHAPDPTDVLWMNHGVTWQALVLQQVASAVIASISMVVLCSIVVGCARCSHWLGALAVSGNNSVIPMMIKYLTVYMEKHPNMASLEVCAVLQFLP